MSAYISTRHLHYQKIGKSFFAEISELPKQRIPYMRVYNDACDIGFWLVSDKTGAEIMMVMTEEKVVNGDVVAWTFTPVDKNAPINNVVIVND